MKNGFDHRFDKAKNPVRGLDDQDMFIYITIGAGFFIAIMIAIAH